MPQEPELVPEVPSGYLPLQLANGHVVYTTPGALIDKAKRDQNKRQAFFDDFKKAAPRDNEGITQPFGKRGTVFTQGIESFASINFGALEKPRDTPNFAFLRAMRKQSMIDQMIINIRLQQVRAVARRSVNPRRAAGWRVMHKNSDDPTFENTDDIKRRCLEMENFVSTRYNSQWHLGGLRSIFMMMTEDELVLDRKFLVYDGIDKRGRPTGFHILDGSTIYPLLDAILPDIDRMAVEKKWSAVQVMANPNMVNEATERLSEQYGVDIVGASYVQMIDNRIVSAWRPDECCLDIINTSTEINRWGYSASALECSLWWSLAFMLAANYNKDLFQQNYPEAILFLFGDYDPEGLEAFKKQVLGESPAGDNYRMPVIPGGDPSTMQARVEKIRDTPKDMMFGQWLKMLTSYKSACYRMNPELLNFDLVHGNDQTLFESETGDARITLAKEEGFDSILTSHGDFLTRSLIEPYYDDLELRWVGLDSMSELTETKMLAQQMNWSTVGEVRAKTAILPPLTGPDEDMNDHILNPTIVQMRQLTLQEKQLQVQKELGEEQIQISEQQATQKQEAGPASGGRQHNSRPRQSPINKQRNSDSNDD